MLFAERGWRVFELSRHGAESTKEVIHVTCDVCSEESCRKAMEEVLTKTDHIDVVISNEVSVSLELSSSRRFRKWSIRWMSTS